MLGSTSIMMRQSTKAQEAKEIADVIKKRRKSISETTSQLVNENITRFNSQTQALSEMHTFEEKKNVSNISCTCLIM